MKKHLFAQNAIHQIPKLLTLLDRNPHSPTYGCFDRNFWQYKIIDFPSGMSQEFVYPLALVYSLNIPNNCYHQKPVIKEWVKAGIYYTMKTSHLDGSCDDYFPFEKAGGATAFSLLACIESYLILSLNEPPLLHFFQKRADWLAHHQESGRLTNHQALIVLCLELLSNLLQTERWNTAKKERLEQVLSWQSSEGWFQEYEGCDPGYHTLTISCLARIYQFYPNNNTLKDALIKAVILAEQFIHPDGSYGGEYSSRNTYNFFPHGFELIGSWFPSALSINDQFLKGLDNDLAPCYGDDHIIGHHTWNYLLAWRDFQEQRPEISPRKQGRFYLKEGGILIERRGDTELYLALNKGGVFKYFKQGKLVHSDTQFSVQVKEKGKVKNAVGHLMGYYPYEIQDNSIKIQGFLGWAKQTQMTPVKLLILRVGMLTLGRFFPNLVRKVLQKMLITGKQKTTFSFSRELIWNEETWQVKDQLEATSWDKILSVGIGVDQTSIYVVMSRTFQKGQLQSWLDLTSRLQGLSSQEKLIVDRIL